MNDLRYIKYKAHLMILDTIAMDKDTKSAHRDLCDYIWGVGELPPHDDGFLRHFTKTDPGDWGRVKRGLMAKGWFVRGSSFCHRGALETLNESQEDYVAHYNQTAAARKVGLLACVTCPDTGIVSYKEASHVTAPVTQPVTQPCNKTSQVPVLVQVQKEYPLPNKPLVQARKGGCGGNPAMLDESGCGRVAARIASNSDDWHYDNCKVPREIATPPSSIVVILKPFVGMVSEDQAIHAWKSSVTLAHQAFVDNLVKGSVTGYCINCFRAQLKMEIGKNEDKTKT